MFLCPKCKQAIDNFYCPACSYHIPQINSIHQFYEGEAMKLEGEDQFIGYDNIGEDFEPGVIFYDKNNVEQYGVYEVCSALIAKHFGNDLTVLDLGSGLGSASIPLAKNGLYTIAADISNVMLATAVKRARDRFNNLIFARMNAYDLMLADASVDIVVENAMLHLVDNPEKVIKEIVRVLKPGGHLIRYGSFPQPLSEEELKQNQNCNAVLADINDKYFEYLQANGHQGIGFYNNNFMEIINKYFKLREDGGINDEHYSEVFTDKLKFRLHRLKTGAHSDLQSTPKDLLAKAWEYADQYAKEKYGDNYQDIKGFSRYGAGIYVYSIKNNHE